MNGNYFGDLRNVVSCDVMRKFDVTLQDFYHDVLSGELDISSTRNVTAIRKALKEVVHAYKKDTVLANASRILYDSVEKRFAYVLKHCPCFGSAVAKHFLRMLRTSPCAALRSAVARGRSVRLCCLGGGPGTEAVAIAKVVGAMRVGHGVENDEEKLHLRVQVVDLSGDWRPMTESVVRTLNRTPSLCGSATRVSVEVLEADLATEGGWDPGVETSLREADVITMVYFVSAVNGSESQAACPAMLKRVMQLAKPDSLLFFLDSARELHYRVVQSAAADQESSMRLVYGPRVQEFHKLSMSSIRRFLELYFQKFGAILCLSDCFVTAAAWTKNARTSMYVCGNSLSKTCIPGSVKEVPTRMSRRQRNKMANHNTKRQEKFRQKVEKLLMSELGMDFLVDDLKDNSHASWESLDSVWTSGESKTLYPTKSKRKRIFT